MYYAENLHVT